MRGVSFGFFAVATLCVTIGMIWGIYMSVIDDHLLAPAHAHLNLVGWVTMALFGIYYHLVPAAAGALARVHLGVATLGVAAMALGIAMAINEQSELPVIIGSFLTLASMLIFGFQVLTHRAA